MKLKLRLPNHYKSYNLEWHIHPEYTVDWENPNPDKAHFDILDVDFKLKMKSGSRKTTANVKY